MAAAYKSVKAPNHPLAGPSGLVLVHRMRLFERIGPGWHRCHWCGELVEWRTGSKPGKGALVVDHLDHDKQNNASENLVPSCNPCNGHRLRGESWEPWVPGEPTGQVDRIHAYCRQGHPLTPENVYIRPDTRHRQCRVCLRARSLQAYRGKTASEHAADRARNRERIACPICGEEKHRGGMRQHIRAMHEATDEPGAGNKGTAHCAKLARRAGIPVRRFPQPEGALW